MGSDEVVFDIGRRVPRLDAAIVVVVYTILVVDLAIIRDPLHTLCAILMIPAARRVLRGFHTLQVSRNGDNWTIASTLFAWKSTAVIPRGSDIVIDRRRSLWGVPLLHVRVDGVTVATIGHHCTAEELGRLTEALQK